MAENHTDEKVNETIHRTEKTLLQAINSSTKTLPNIDQFRVLQDQLGFPIEKSKYNYYPKLSQKLSDQTTSTKTYWSILKTFLNDKKSPWIPPVFHDYEFVTDFGEKAELFCYQTTFHFSLTSVMSKSQTTIEIINNLDSNKTHGPDIISIQMLK